MKRRSRGDDVAVEEQYADAVVELIELVPPALVLVGADSTLKESCSEGLSGPLAVLTGDGRVLLDGGSDSMFAPECDGV